MRAPVTSVASPYSSKAVEALTHPYPFNFPTESPKTSGNPAGNQWFWGLNGVQNGSGPLNNGFVRTLEDAKAKFAAAWGAWLKAAGLNEDTPTAQLEDSDSGST
jgi:hypothetical protein